MHLIELLGEGHAGEEPTDATLDRRARIAAEARVGALGREHVVGGRAGHAEEAPRERAPVRRRVARDAEVGSAERRAPAAGRDAGRRPAPEPREPGGERRVFGAIAPGREGAGRMPVAWREEANAAEERLARAARRLELAGPRRLGQRGGRGVGDGQHRVCVGIMGADEAARDRVRVRASAQSPPRWSAAAASTEHARPRRRRATLAAAARRRAIAASARQSELAARAPVATARAHAASSPVERASRRGPTLLSARSHRRSAGPVARAAPVASRRTRSAAAPHVGMARLVSQASKMRKGGLEPPRVFSPQDPEVSPEPETTEPATSRRRSRCP